MDVECLQVGGDWDFQIKEAISKCSAFFACISNNSIEKNGYVQRELRLALMELEKKPQGTSYLCPILFDNSEVPNLQVSSMNIKDYHAIQYFNENEREKLLNSLVSQFQLPERMTTLNLFKSNDREYTRKIRFTKSGRKEINDVLSMLGDGDLKSAIDILMYLRISSPILESYNKELALLVSKPSIVRMFGKNDTHKDVILSDKLTKEALKRILKEALFLDTYEP
jgi:hypothetical protein